MAIKLDDLQTILIESGLSTEQRQNVIRTAKQFEDEAASEREVSPKTKSKLTVLIRGDESLADTIQQAWIVKTPDEQDDNSLLDRLKLAAVKHNEGLKKKKHLVELWRDVFFYIKRKTTKVPEINVDVKTKEPVRVVIIPNERVAE
jgi:hypothetical protein